MTAASSNGAIEEEIPLLTRKDFVSDQEVRWCPGCGDYSILAQMQKTLPGLRIPREEIVFVSGIGCSSRFPYYVNTYGFHTIHGRAPAIATGLKTARPELTVFVVTGDGDGLSIGGNHLMHLLRRNVDVTVVLFNNRIYGLTKGQYSPTSPIGKVTKSAPMGTTENPLDPIKLALASGASFVARSVDRDTKHLEATLATAAQHKGASFVEVFQNCNIYNDGAFASFADKDVRQDRMVYLENGKPLRYGKHLEHGIRLNGSSRGRRQPHERRRAAGARHGRERHRPPDDPQWHGLPRLPRAPGRLPAGRTRDVRRVGAGPDRRVSPLSGTGHRGPHRRPRDLERALAATGRPAYGRNAMTHTPNRTGCLSLLRGGANRGR